MFALLRTNRRGIRSVSNPRIFAKDKGNTRLLRQREAGFEVTHWLGEGRVASRGALGKDKLGRVLRGQTNIFILGSVDQEIRLQRGESKVTLEG